MIVPYVSQQDECRRDRHGAEEGSPRRLRRRMSTEARRRQELWVVSGRNAMRVWAIAMSLCAVAGCSGGGESGERCNIAGSCFRVYGYDGSGFPTGSVAVCTEGTQGHPCGACWDVTYTGFGQILTETCSFCNLCPSDLEGGSGGDTDTSGGGSATLAIDLLWVVDNTASMCQEQVALARSFEQLVETLAQREGLDIRTAVVTTDVSDEAQAGRFRQTATEEFTPACVEGRPFPARTDLQCECAACDDWDAASAYRRCEDDSDCEPEAADAAGYVACVEAGRCAGDALAVFWRAEPARAEDHSREAPYTLSVIVDAECVAQEDCAAGTFCDEGMTFTCLPGCLVDANCAEGELCFDAACIVPQCHTHGDCAAGQACVDYACMDTDCSVEDTCADYDLVCNTDTGACVACLTEAECPVPAEYLCEANACVLQCTEDGHEPNRTSDDAVTLDLTSDFAETGLTLCGARDEDWFTFELAADMRYDFDLASIHDDGDVDYPTQVFPTRRTPDNQTTERSCQADSTRACHTGRETSGSGSVIWRHQSSFC